MRPRYAQLSAHLVRAAVMAGAMAFHPAAGVAFFLAAFSFFHDLAHGALRLPARVNHALLGLAGAMMLSSGHAMRVGHLRHHAAPLAADDFEGAAAHGPLWRAILRAPWYSVVLRCESWRRASRRERRFQIVEYAIALALAAVVPRTYLVVVLLLQFAAPVWAGRIPHTAPPMLIELARRLAWTRSPTLLSLGFHDVHHEHPAVPTSALPTIA